MGQEVGEPQKWLGLADRGGAAGHHDLANARSSG